MDVLDAARTTGALLVGYVVAVVGIELFPAYAIMRVPLTWVVGLAAGVAATVAIRKVLRTTEYATLTGTALFVIVGGAMVAQGDSAPIPAADAELILYFGGAGFVANELLVRTRDMAAAGGVQQSDRHRIWAVPAAVVGLGVIAARRLEIDGWGGAIAWILASIVVVAHPLANTTGLTVAAEPIAGLALLALFTVFPASSPNTITTDDPKGAVTGALVTWTVGAGRTLGTALGRAADHARVLGRRFRRTVAELRLPSGRASPTGAGAGSTSVDRGTNVSSAVESDDDPTSDDARTAESSTSTAAPRTEDSGAAGNMGSTAATATAAAGSTSTAGSRAAAGTTTSAGSSETTPSVGSSTARSGTTTERSSSDRRAESAASGETKSCDNCGRDHRTVRSRLIVDTEDDRATGTIQLCAHCHSARRSEDATWQCTTAVPVARRRVLSVSDGRCRACGRGPADVLELHPVVPLASRGHPHEHNVAALCPSCHATVHSGE